MIARRDGFGEQDEKGEGIKNYNLIFTNQLWRYKVKHKEYN